MTRCSAPREISVSEETAEKCGSQELPHKEDRRDNGSTCKEAGTCQVNGKCACTSAGQSIKMENGEPKYDVFLGGSCGTTVWRRQLVIPFLKKRQISYYDPQRSVWSENMIYEESIAKENSSLFLFVIDPATVNATSFLEIAYFAARKSPKLVVVFLGKTEWAEKAHPGDLPDRNRTCQLLDRILEAHKVPMLHNIQDALEFIEEEMLGRKALRDVLSQPAHRIPYISMKARRLARSARSRAGSAYSTMRMHATRATVAGLADTLALIFCTFALPNIPLYFILIPLLIINFIVFMISSKWKQVRRKYPRVIADSSVVTYNTTAAIPSPRLSTLTTSINGNVTSPAAVSRRSKQMFEKLVTDDGSNSFVIPRSMSHQRDVKVSSDCHALELCSSSLTENKWIQDLASPLMDPVNIVYNTALTNIQLLPEIRMNCLKMWQAHHKNFFYYIPNTQTFLSGMVEIAYILGHSNWNATVCVPPTSQILEGPDDCQDEDEMTRAARRRRNDCYQIAFCYLKDMAKRRQCHVFTQIDVALHFLVEQKIRGNM